MKSSIAALTVILSAAILILLVVLLWGQGKQAPATTVVSWPEVTLNGNDRLLILAPHPDDEVLGCGGIIQQALALRLPVRVVFLTYGDFYEWSFVRYKGWPVLTPRGVEGMGEIRHDEALAAASTLGLSSGDVQFLGYPDFGTLEMWYRAWGQAPPVKGMLTRATAVPYNNALRPGAPYKGEEVLKSLTSILREFQPTKVFVSHPADHHPDHRAFYLFARVALFDVEQELSPQIYPYLVHYSRWPTPEGNHPNEPMQPPATLTDPIPWSVVPLNAQQEAAKAAALECHKTQMKASSRFLRSFVRSNELFGDFPPVVLQAQTPPRSLSDKTDFPTPSPEIVERAHWVGIVEWTVQVEEDALVFLIRLTRPPTKEVGSSLYLFGYRRDEPFAQMPKFHIKFGPIFHQFYNQDREIPPEQVQVTRSGRDIHVRVPLAMMGHPQRILASVRTYVAAVPLDWQSWQILEVGNAPTLPSPSR
jgi:LmbE family N-acetylglucosaminyl deacetylase